MQQFFKITGFAILSLIFFSANLVSASDKMKIVYHVSDVEKVPFVIGNMKNHIKGVGGAGNLDMILVVHGPAGKSFHKSKATAKVKKGLEILELQGVRFNMCGNTMRAQKVKIGDLLPGFSRRDEGGVVRIAELQSKGYIYQTIIH